MKVFSGWFEIVLIDEPKESENENSKLSFGFEYKFCFGFIPFEIYLSFLADDQAKPA